LMSTGVLSAGWCSVVTGSALLYVSSLLGSASEDDAAAMPVAVALAVTGSWQLVRGLSAEFERRPKSTGERL
jgi:hypothetical protein